MPVETQIASIAHTIQLSVAPVFLLSGIGALLSVMTNRLARIVDRARAYETQFASAAPGRAKTLRDGLHRLGKRARVISYGISLVTSCAILVCILIIALFMGTFVEFGLSSIIAVLFVLAMACLMAGLLCFLREIYLATRYLRIGVPDDDGIVTVVKT